MSLVSELKKGNQTLTLKVNELQKEKNCLLEENKDLKRDIRVLEENIKTLESRVNCRASEIQRMFDASLMSIESIMRYNSNE